MPKGLTGCLSLTPPYTLHLLCTCSAQTGFRCPELYAVIFVSAFKLDAAASIPHLNLFYYSTAGIVLAGLGAWCILCFSTPAQRFCSLKDGASTNQQEAAEISLGDESQAAVAKTIFLCRVSVFINIFSSVFTAAFFAYVPEEGGVSNLPIVLYFVRLFSDLAGRPLSAVLERRFGRWITTMWGLVVCVLCRMFLAVIFFAYITPGSPVPRSDLLIIVVIAVFSALSGYLCILSYEFAAASQTTKAGQTRACALMNTTFQAACFTSVVVGVLVSSSGFFGSS